MPAPLLALVASFTYGCSAYLGGLKSRTLPPITVLMISQAAALAALAATFLLAVGVTPEGKYFGYGILAGLAEAIGLAALYRGLAAGKVSIVIAVAAVAPVVPIGYSLLNGEAPGTVAWLGIIFAAVGVSILAFMNSTGSTPVAKAVVSTSVLFGLVAAFGLGSFFLAMDAAAEGSVQWALLSARLTTLGLFTLAFLVIRPKGDLNGNDWAILVLIGLLVLVADSFFAVASVKGALAVVAVLSSLFPVVTILLARFQLGERLTKQQIGGIVVVLVGVAALWTAV